MSAAAPESPITSAERTLNRALSLIEKGYHVFPVRVVVDPATGANTKTYVTGRKDSPTGANWNATTDANLIRSWWGPDSRLNDCMIGVSTEPSGVVLIDLDVKNKPGGIPQDGIAEWAKLYPDPYPFPAAVGTSSTGGRHLAYRANPKRPVRTTAGEVAPAVDTRGIGGMFVCWANWLPKVSELPDVPAIVPDRVPFVERIVVGVPALPAVQSGDLADLDEVKQRVLYHRDVIAVAAEGEGVPTASRQAFLAGQHVGAGQVDQQWVTAALVGALGDWTWRKDGDRAKVEQQIRKGVVDGMREPRPWTTEVVAPVYVLHPDRQTGPQQPQDARQAPDGAEGDDDTGGGSDAPRGRHLAATPASSIRLRRVRWLWEGRWALGTITLVAGKQGLGKSTIVYDRVARITRGELEGEFFGLPKAALVAATEDSWEFTIAPRLIAAGADLNKVFKVDAVEDEIHTGLILPRDVFAVERLAVETDAAVLVLDPMTSRLDSGLDSHKDSETRRALEPLADVADRAALVVAGLMHLNKGGKADPMDSVMASTAFTAVARSVSIAMYDPDDEEGRRKLFGTPKNNLGRSDLPTLAFVTTGYDVETEDGVTNVGRIEWIGEIEGSIADAMERAGQDPETRTAIGDAAEWLRNHLTACGGQADSSAVRDAGRAEGHNARTLQRALKRIGGRAESVKDTFPRRTLYTIPPKKDKLSLLTSGDTQTRQLSTSLKAVMSVVSVATSDDSGDRYDRISVREDLSRLDVVTGDAAPGQPAPERPSWLAEAAARAAEPVDEAPAVPPCPCGRSESLHSRGNWTTCRDGHRWHAFGHRCLKRCPQCPEPTTGGDAA